MSVEATDFQVEIVDCTKERTAVTVKGTLLQPVVNRLRLDRTINFLYEVLLA